MAKITLDDITSNYASTTQLNTRFQLLEDALNNQVLYRDNPVGEPNSMQNDLDMNSNDILNAGTIDTQALTLGGVPLTVANVGVAQNEVQTLAAGQTTVVFNEPITNATFYLSGNDVDNGRLTRGVDFTADVANKTVTLTDSYPAGTQIISVYFTSDETYQAGISDTDVQSISVLRVTAQGGETQFTFSDFAYQMGTNNLSVYRNGMKMRQGNDYTETTQRIITLDPSVVVEAGEEWEFVSLNGVSGNVNGGTPVLVRQNYDGDDVTVTFTLPYAFNSGGVNTIVSVGGLVQNLGTYSISGTQLTFTEAPPAGSGNIEFIGIASIDAAALVTGFELSSDTSPQLGADLDLNTYDITGTGIVNITGANEDVATFNRSTAEGPIARFQYNGSDVVYIRSRAGVVGTIVIDPRQRGDNTGGIGITGSGGTGATPTIMPCNYNGDPVHDDVSLGTGGTMFKNLWLSGLATINEITCSTTMRVNDSIKVSNSLSDVDLQLKHSQTINGKTYAAVMQKTPTESLGFFMDGASNTDRISFMTDYTSTGTYTERMSIKADTGFVGIGKTTPTCELDVEGVVKTKLYTVATLPAAATAGTGARAMVSDATATTFASTVAGGGANIVPVYSDGVNWKIG